VRAGVPQLPVRAALFVVALIALAVALHELLPIGYDFYHWYRPVPLAWLSGELDDPSSRGFYSPPWVIWLLIPFAALPIRWGMAALTLLSLAITAGVSYAYGHEMWDGRPRPSAQAGAPAPHVRRTLAIASSLAVLCPYSLTAVFAGTLDAWSLLGIYLGYRALRESRPWSLGAALVLAATRPQDALLTGPALLLGARGWSRGHWLRVALLPAATLLLSLAVFGLDWPLRWIEHYQTAPPGGGAGIPQRYLVTSTYSATNLAGIPLPLVLAMTALLVAVVLRRVWMEGLRPATLGLAVTANAIISPHMLSQGYIVLLALPWVRLALRRPLPAALLYAVSLPVLFRATEGLWDRLGLLDVTFPLILMVVLLLERGDGPKGVEGAEPNVMTDA